VLRTTIARRVDNRFVTFAAGSPSGVSHGSDRRLPGDESEDADVGSGSLAAGEQTKLKVS
jgi:hypothetical protein